MTKVYTTESKGGSILVTMLEGFIQGLIHEHDEPVRYQLHIGDDKFPIEVGNQVIIEFLNEKSCINCGRRVNKLYQNGYCFPCVQTLAECDLCVLKPHECHYHLGTCRDEAWGESHCMIPHYVYLAVSSDIKVGLTRRGRQLTRWMEQGAEQAMVLAELPTRKMAGELEMEIAKTMPDKTNWRKMLKVNNNRRDLQAIRNEVVSALPEEWQSYLINHEGTEHTFAFPRQEEFEPKTTSISLDKNPKWQGTVRGLKGQYLIFDDGVMNLRKHTGYKVQVSVS